MAIIHDESKPEIINILEPDAKDYYQPTENDEKLLKFIVDHTDRWRDYRDQNYSQDWKKYERMFRGKWDSEDKTRGSERSKIISPATQQAIETRHAEIMEAIFGQGEYFDIDDDLNDINGKVDVEKLKNQLKEDYAQDKVRKSIENISLLAEIYGTGIGEIIITTQKQYKPMQVPVAGQMTAYGTGETERISVRLSPVNPNNFLCDPNGISIDDCMGVAIEKYVSIHKIVAGIKEGKYRDVELSTIYENNSQEATQETSNYQDDKVLLLTYYGLVPRETLSEAPESDTEELLPKEPALKSDDFEDYEDMVEAIIVIVNGKGLLKAEISPYMMQDRPVISYQADTVPNRLHGRGTAEKSLNMQVSIDGSIRSHMDGLALTSAPMMAMDATRVPRGFKFEVKPGQNVMTNGNPNEILYPFTFGQVNGSQMETSKEFERMLLMATGTMDSAGQVSQVSRDGNMDMATATMIKKYKRTLINFQEDFLMPWIYKSAWRYMQFDPERYPAVDVKFIPTATLGIIAREYEQKQMAFLIQTLGAQSPLTPILMQGLLKNSSNPDRESMIEQMKKMSQPDPQQQQMQQQSVMLDIQGKQADVAKTQAEAQQIAVDTQLAPDVAKAKIISALSNNLDEDNEGKDFEKRARIAELMLKEKDIASNENIAKMQMSQVEQDKQSKKLQDAIKIDEHKMNIEAHGMKKEELSLKKQAKKPVKITAPSGDTYTAE
ncbi:MAG TPA: hypothetical protein VN368_02755 [Candidatus Methylomirabilis sp.]|nr:hypothetical protein [Candidatus Methylomirabilis sp.]